MPQTEDQKRVEQRIYEMADHYGRRLGLSRRQFLRTMGGMAVSFLAMNEVFGHFFDVDAAEAAELAAYAEKWPKREFIFDVQTHHVKSSIAGPLIFRTMAAQFNRDLAGVTPKAGDLDMKNYLKEIFFDSDTLMGVISGIPSIDDASNILPVDLMVETRNLLNSLAQSQRLVSHGLSAPNKAGNLEEIERQVKDLKIDAWKCYTGVPLRTGPWWMDDEKVAYPFLEKTRKLGVKNVCVHKGLPLTGFNTEYCHPKDIRKAALDFPDLNFIVYHSGFKNLVTELNRGETGVDEKGTIEWTSVLVNDRVNNPKMTNVYMELGSTFGQSVISHPAICAHVMGQIIKAFGADHVIWGTDSIWWGSPQWQIEAFRRFQIPEDMQKKFGYKPLSAHDKELIFGLNAARVYNVDVKAKRQAFPNDALSKLKAEYQHHGPQPSNTAYGWVSAEL